MKINKTKLTPYNFTNKNDTGRIKYIVIHYFGSFATAKNLADYWASKYVGASAHYAVGHDGSVYQCVEDGDIAWHCGASTYKHKQCRNTNSIGIEMAVSKKNKKTANASDKDWYFEKETVQSTVALTKELMQRYQIPPENVIRHYDVTGKCCPNPYVLNLFEYNWEQFKQAILLTESEVPTVEEELTVITGECLASAEQMASYLVHKNLAALPAALRMANLYQIEGASEGIRGDISFAQSLVETGNYTFAGSAVTPKQYNYGGLGVLNNGMQGESFKSEQEGIRAMIQHLKAYANKEPLKKGCVDTRFKYVERGISPYVEHLGIQENPLKKGWAAGSGYGQKILRILQEIVTLHVSPEEEQMLIDAMRAHGSTPQQPSPTPATSYEIKIYGCSILNIRSAASADSKVVGKISDQNRYTIVEEKNGWGRLKSGAGWIKLSYTKKVS